MKIIICGNGKFAKDIKTYFNKSNIETKNIDDIDTSKLKENFDAIVYAGSERNMSKAQNISLTNKIPIILLSTNFEIKDVKSCIYKSVNTSSEIKEFFSIIKDFAIRNNLKLKKVIESHQSNKKDVSGTARKFVEDLHEKNIKIKSIRDKDGQIKIGIPKKYLDSHAYHKIILSDGNNKFVFEKMILGKETYIKGILKIINELKNKKYKIGINII